MGGAPEQWKLFVAVHTSAPMALSRALVHDMMRQKWGRIVNVTTSLGTMRAAAAIRIAARSRQDDRLDQTPIVVLV